MELLPCPFCGSKNLGASVGLSDFFKVCNDCGGAAPIYQWNNRHSPWISVKDRLPDLDQYVIGHCIRYGNKYVDTTRLNNNVKTKWWSDTFDEPISVTHWMPLPEPPFVKPKE